MHSAPDPDLDLAARLFDSLRAQSFDGVGVTRDAYGAGEQRAHDLVRACARDLDLPVRVDASGNLYVTLPGRDPARPARMTGSHLDSVPAGGNFDGAAGVVAGLAVLAGWRAAGWRPAADVTVMAIRAEESTWFPYSYLGSKAAFGLAAPDVLDLRRADTGRSLRDHLADLSIDPQRYGQPALRAAGIDRYVELHIEQGPTLVEAGLPAGIVTGIRGSFRYRDMAWHGEYAHSGAVGRAHRRDAVRAAALWMASLDRDWETLEDFGDDLVVTVGKVATDPQQHAFSKVAGELQCCVDVRSISATLLERFDRLLRQRGVAAARATGTRVDFGPRTGSAPAAMDPGLIARLTAQARQRGIAALSMPSGAGHDAAIFAQQGIPTAMIFVRNEHGSHNPHEAMDMADFACATQLLSDILADDQPVTPHP
ncbi:putative N-carbamoyl-L-amino-acid hydrolase [Bordetella bronchiseptica MBORD635]|uniref:Zn-dependent hydrolase n=1 Tax=Bordetella bronchiseptica TaxID=518 RepID=UPI0004616BCD|nr:Zn-dependent hydrolase [Bordetella bronchiseptica]KDC79174.1 putative N-carbamoyl-L-amino-acid hydrolase [Bordetella bronchiseptica MBORD635]